MSTITPPADPALHAVNALWRAANCLADWTWPL
jgi:hypothetical protein